MIKDCRINDLPIYGYDIDYKGEKIARAHLLDICDKTSLFESLFVKKGETATIEMQTACIVISKALDSWEFADKDNKGLPITIDNIKSLLPEYVYCLITAIVNQESEAMATAKVIEKN